MTTHLTSNEDTKEKETNLFLEGYSMRDEAKLNHDLSKVASSLDIVEAADSARY